MITGSPPQYTPTPNIHSYQLIWLDKDSNITTTSENDETQNKLKQIIPDFHTFNDCESCVDYLTDACNQKIIFIVSDSYGYRIVPVVHDFPQLQEVYIHCTNPLSNGQWSRSFSKVKGIHKNMDNIVLCLKSKQPLCEQTAENNLVMNIYSIKTEDNTSVQELKTKKNASFIFLLHFFDVLLKVPTNYETAKREFVNIWRKACQGNEHLEAVVTEFENGYNPERAIEWYTKHSFVYEKLNKSLRDRDIETMFTMRFFTFDLYQQLNDMHTSCIQHQTSEPFLYVYRGQAISSEELDMIRTNQHELVTFNSFLSASKNQQVAKGFALSNDRPEIKRILLQIRIPTRLSSVKPYADISTVSCFSAEQEILFSLGSIFYIDEVIYIEDEVLWLAKLTLCAENSGIFEDTMTQFRRLSRENSTALGWFLYREGEYDQARQFFRIFLKEESLNDSQRDSCYHGLGLISIALEEYDEALAYETECFSLSTKLGNHERIATTHMAFGEVYWQRNQFDLALGDVQKARDIFLQLNLPIISGVYQTLGNIHQKRHEFDLAIECYNKAIDIDRQHYSPNDSKCAIPYKNMAAAYYEKKQYKEALECLNEARDILLRSVSSHCPDFLTLESYIDSLKAEMNQK